MASTALVTAFIDGLGGPEVLLVMFIALVLFGGKSLPSFARTVGKSLREFKKATGDVEREIRKAIEEAPEEQPVRPKAVSPVPSPVAGVPAAPAVAEPAVSSPVPQELSPYAEVQVTLAPKLEPETVKPVAGTAPTQAGLPESKA